MLVYFFHILFNPINVVKVELVGFLQAFFEKRGNLRILPGFAARPRNQFSDPFVVE